MSDRVIFQHVNWAEGSELWITQRMQAKRGSVRLRFDRRVRLEFQGSKVSSDGGLLLFRELDAVLGLHDIVDGVLRDTRTGHNRLHTLLGLLRQSVFDRLAGYDDVNDTGRLAL